MNPSGFQETLEGRVPVHFFGSHGEQELKAALIPPSNQKIQYGQSRVISPLKILNHQNGGLYIRQREEELVEGFEQSPRNATGLNLRSLGDWPDSLEVPRHHSEQHRSPGFFQRIEGFSDMGSAECLDKGVEGDQSSQLGRSRREDPLSLDPQSGHGFPDQARLPDAGFSRTRIPLRARWGGAETVRLRRLSSVSRPDNGGSVMVGASWDAQLDRTASL